MSRKALLIGIDDYDNINCLDGCVNDAKDMSGLLARHDSGVKNFDCKLYTSSDIEPITRRFLREKLNELFEVSFDGHALFYFSGHGTPTEVGGYLVTQDAEEGDLGIAMNDVLTLANNSRAKSVLIILDCCFSGAIGNAVSRGNLENQATLREGVTILAASRPTQTSLEINGHGVFTQLLVGALSGGAADVRGRVSAAAVYAYAEQALGPWDQRPLYKSHADSLPELRWCTPLVEDSLLRQLPQIFEEPTSIFKMDPSFEHTKKKIAVKENVQLFDLFKCFRNAGLLKTEFGDDLYYTALQSKGVLLTQLGQFYWQLANSDRL